MPPRPEFRPWRPPAYDLADVYAIKAVAAGTANEDQQRRAMQWIINKAAMTYDETYQPDSARDTDFAQGKAFVGRQIVKLINLPGAVLAKMRTTDERNSDGT
jgi:hypothetical protein